MGHILLKNPELASISVYCRDYNILMNHQFVVIYSTQLLLDFYHFFFFVILKLSSPDFHLEITGKVQVLLLS